MSCIKTNEVFSRIAEKPKNYNRFFLFLISACEDLPQISPIMRLDVQDVGFAEPALARSVNAFLGKGIEGSNDDDQGFSNDGEGSDNESSSSDDETLDNVNFNIRDLHETSAGFMFHGYKSDSRKFGLRILAGRGRAEVRLPNGADIFVDPLTITAKTRFVEATVTLEQVLTWPRFLSNHISVTAEAGHRYTKSTVDLRSALIRRNDTGTDKQTFTGAGFSIAVGPRRATAFDLGLRYIRGETPIVRLGIARRF